MTQGVERFDRQTPSRVWGVSDGQLRDLACPSPSCRIIGTAVLLMDTQAGCEGAVVAVSHLSASCAAAPIVDALTTRQAGATAIRLTRSGPVLRTDADVRGDRPWVLREAAASVTARLPPAQTE